MHLEGQKVDKINEEFDQVSPHNLAIMVLSGRESISTRKVIRQTWANPNFAYGANIAFLIGQSCPYVKKIRQEAFGCELNETSVETGEHAHEQEDYIAMQKALDVSLALEDNVVFLPFVDTYWNLTLKLLMGYKHLLENTNASWFLKADVDQFVRILELQKFLGKFNSSNYVAVGKVNKATRPNGQGKKKWDEKTYSGINFQEVFITSTFSFYRVEFLQM